MHEHETNGWQVLAHRPGDRLYHAKQAVENAQMGVQSRKGRLSVKEALKILDEAEETLQAVLDNESDDDTEDDDSIDDTQSTNNQSDST